MDNIHAGISTAPLDIAAAHAFVDDAGHGAVTSFVGVVRNLHEGKPVSGIHYDVYPPLAEKVFTEMALEAREKWPGMKVFIEHFQGYLPVGGISVLIVVSAPHRAEAFDGCRYLIEELKQRAPVWKREYYPDGPSEWLPGHSLRGRENPEVEDAPG